MPSSLKNKPQRCQWCGKIMDTSVVAGRKRRYCKQSCRQRAYEQRQKLKSTDIPSDSVILTEEHYSELLDNLYELRCAAEDIQTAAHDHEPSEDIEMLCTELMDLAHKVEGIRTQ